MIQPIKAKFNGLMCTSLERLKSRASEVADIIHGGDEALARLFPPFVPARSLNFFQSEASEAFLFEFLQSRLSAAQLVVHHCRLLTPL